MKQWFYTHNGQQQGPVQESDLMAMFTSGKLQADVLVWTEGLSNWTPAREIESLVPSGMTPPPIPAPRSAPPLPGALNAPYQKSAHDNQEISGFGWYLDAWRQYGVAQGRSRRKAYWMFYLFDTIFTIVASIADTMLFNTAFEDWGPLCIIYTLATIVPFVNVSIRRMHDTGHSGWWILFPIVNLVFLCTDSKPGDNKYGPNPKGR
jgi:uncharacterized membrane protein YhaH (DUF805 family)